MTAVAVLETWRAFRLHSEDCDKCRAAADAVRKGGKPDIDQALWFTCDEGRALFEDWYHAVDDRVKEVTPGRVTRLV